MSILDAAALVREELERAFPPEHVDEHLVHGQLALIAGFYAGHAAGHLQMERLPSDFRGWTWTPVGWPKPIHTLFWAPRADPRENLARSIAYAAMEADRLDRAAAALRGAA